LEEMHEEVSPRDKMINRRAISSHMKNVLNPSERYRQH